MISWLKDTNWKKLEKNHYKNYNNSILAAFDYCLRNNSILIKFYIQLRVQTYGFIKYTQIERLLLSITQQLLRQKVSFFFILIQENAAIEVSF